jgi:hypothetical protein
MLMLLMCFLRFQWLRRDQERVPDAIRRKIRIGFDVIMAAQCTRIVTSIGRDRFPSGCPAGWKPLKAGF